LRLLLLILILICNGVANAQTIGGEAVFNFLKLPPSPLLTASGGVNVSYTVPDVGMASNQPALFNEALHSVTGLSFNNYFAGINAYHISGAYHVKEANITLGGSIFYVDYGNLQQTDAAGNNLGSFHPRDYTIQISAAKKYLEKWQYGLSLKFIQSNYGQYNSSAIAFDAGISYKDSAALFSAGLVAKNMGVQLKTFQGTGEDLPFDMQLGLTKKLAAAPIAFSVTAQHLHQWDINYNDTIFNQPLNESNNNSFADKLFNHFVVATHINLGNNLEVLAGYNRLRRSELNIGSDGNGLNGFSMGFAARFRKLQVQYGRAYFQRNTAYNQFAIHIKLDEMFGLGSL
jgi:hypothetical protein